MACLSFRSLAGLSPHATRPHVALVVLATALAAAPAPLTAAEIVDARLDARVDRTSVRLDSVRLDLSLTLQAAFPEEIQNRVRSGLEVSFEYTVRLRRRRNRITDKTVSERYVVTSVQYSNLTKMYRVTRAVDGAEIASDVTDRPDVMRTWMTEIVGLPLFDARDTETPGTYYVRVRAKLLGRFAMLVIPWDLETPWVETPPLEIERSEP